MSQRSWVPIWPFLSLGLHPHPSVPSEDSLSARDRFRAILEALDGEGQLNPEQRIRLENWWVANETARMRLESWYIWNGVAKLGVYVGIIVALVGFAFWYTQLQRHVDKLTERQANPPEPPASGRRHKFE